MKINEATDEIKQGKMNNYYLIAGEEDYLRELALKSLLAGLDIQMQELNVSVFPEGAENIIGCLEGMPMMSERRAVIAGLPGLAEPELKQLGSYLPNMPKSTVLILLKPTKPEKNKAVEAYILKNGLVIDCPAPSESETVDFLCGYAAKNGMKLSRSDALLLLQFASGGLNHLISELDKLIAVCGEQITRKDIQKYTVKSSGYNIFLLHDYFLQKKWAEARGLLDEIQNDESETRGLLSLLSVNFELMLIARACHDAGFRDGETRKNLIASSNLASSSPKSADFRARKAMEQSRFMDAAALRAALQKLSRLDFDSKQGNVTLKNDLFAILCGIYGLS